MSSLIKTIIGLLLILIVGAYIVDSQPVSNVLQTGQKGADPLVSGAKTVKQELRVLTDEAHQDAYKKAVKSGLKKVVNVLNSFIEEDSKGRQANPKTAPYNRENSL